ncbi:hypothetical protein ANCCEY_06974 [Ancylostoma ceylanicum]|uniref:G-protein coupled receptors family 1 profile domain-containing protein n=1 Tax=Ancylostoma ceylanicum TaxID=53326 RepID=A0A0D6M1Z4_9BILA|nr:hypothetical protein ANCCEY_06974 [Ancylostoma ceylanicum]
MLVEIFFQQRGELNLHGRMYTIVSTLITRDFPWDGKNYPELIGEMEVSIFMGIVCMVVVCGNIFVLYVLVSQPSLHTTTNFLVLSLTISDLLLGTAIIPFAIIQA